MAAAAAGFKRIITKAVYGRKKASLTSQVELPIGGEPRPVAVLGQVIANPRIIGAEVTGSGSSTGGSDAVRAVRVTGGLDLHIWYRTHEDTRVVRMPVQFTEDIVVPPPGDEPFRDLTATAHVTGRPECTEVELLGTTATGRVFRARVKLDVDVEIVGITELNVQVTTAAAEEDAGQVPPIPTGPGASSPVAIPPVAPVEPLPDEITEDDNTDD